MTLVTNKIGKAKHTYFWDKLNSSSGNTKNTWRVINQNLRPNNEIGGNKVNSFINFTGNFPVLCATRSFV